jgi:predicted phosphodiesterase
MKKIIVLLLLLCLNPVPVYSAIITRPYLQAVTTSSIYVLAECDSPSKVSVDYGTTPGYGMSVTDESVSKTTENTFVHKVRLSGLMPDSVYHYKVNQDGPATDDARFRTAVKKGTAFRFAFMADCRTNTHIHNKIAQQILKAKPAFSIYGGDISSDASYESFKSEFFTKSELALDARVPFFLAVGNHEGWGINTMAFSTAPRSLSNSQAYYSFDYGDMHVLILNTQLPCTPESAQYAFAASDLASTNRTWKIVVYHKPAYCAGGHGENAEMITMTKNIFEPNHVSAVLNGHSHFYQHNLVNGIHHMIIGDAGAPPEELASAPYTVKMAQKYNYAVGDVSASSFTLNVYDENGAPIDSVSFKKPAAR